MRAMLWIAASGVLFASGAALADADRPSDQGLTVRYDDVSEASPARSGDELSKMQPADARPQEKAPPPAAVPPNVVTVDPAHPGGEFPFGG